MMLAASRSKVDRTSSSARARPATSPSLKPAWRASRVCVSISCSSSRMRASNGCEASAAGLTSAAIRLRSTVSPVSATVRQANGRTPSAPLSGSTLVDILVAAALQADHAFGLQLLDLRDNLLLGGLDIPDANRSGGLHILLQHLGASLRHA